MTTFRAMALCAAAFSCCSASLAFGAIELAPTYTCCSVTYKAGNGGTVPALEWRMNGGEWKSGPALYFFADRDEWRGSLMGLPEACEVECRIGNSETARTRTWSSRVPIAETIEIDPTTIAKYPYRAERSGTEKGWVRYTVKPGATLGGAALETSVVRFEKVHHVVFENATVRGGGGGVKNSPVTLSECSDVRLANLDVSGWGLVGKPLLTARAGGKFVMGDLSAEKPAIVDWQAAVMLAPGCRNVTVERCWLHDPRGRSNSWYYSHPAGFQGVFVAQAAGGIVLRWNDIVGSDLHRWNDAIEGFQNFAEDGGFNRDSDVYGNFCIYANDDLVELDGGMRNVRCFGNRMEGALCGVSIQGCMVSPVYLVDNQLGPCGDEFGITHSTVKTSGFAPQDRASVAYFKGNRIVGASVLTNQYPKARFVFDDGNVVGMSVPKDAESAVWPRRDLPFRLGTGRLEFCLGKDAGDSVGTVEVLADRTCAYHIKKNDVFDWFTVSPAYGRFAKGKNALAVKLLPGKMSSRRYWRGAFLVDDGSGLTRPVSVTAENLAYEQPARPVPGGDGTSYGRKAESGNAKVVRWEFDLADGRNRWLHVRAQGKGRDFTVCEIAIDGGGWKRTAVRTYAGHAAWSFAAVGRKNRIGNNGNVVPLELSAGKHVVEIRDFPGHAMTISGVALTDDPSAFEMH